MTDTPKIPQDSSQRPSASPSEGRGWRWWFMALGPWAGVAVAIAALFGVR